MNTATNPRTPAKTAEGNDTDTGTTTLESQDRSDGEDQGDEPGEVPDADLDRRTRPQRLLDGLIGACQTALATGTLPAAGGLRPQVMVTIDYRDLLARLERATNQGPRYRSQAADTSHGYGSTGGNGGYGSTGSTGHPDTDDNDDNDGFESTPADYDGSATIPGTGSFTFTGPVPAATVRKIACDADIIPVLLGSEGRILDIGRTTRIFPPHLRKALTARDQGCAFPTCTIPAPWCEAHHTTYWSHGGPTNTDNGVLLCTHHHHLIHKEQWKITTTDNTPMFIPPPHIDPTQTPQQNHYFKPPPPPHGSG
jgi:hypothetical protein